MNKKPKILLVEDDIQLAQSMIKILERLLNCKVIFATTGEQGVDLYNADIDLIIMDVGLPGIDGIEATSRIKRLDSYADTPVVAMTAGYTETNIKSCLEVGMEYVYKKPPTREKLEKLLKRHVGV